MFSNLSNRTKLMALATFIIALIAIPLTIIQVQKQQETRQHAASIDSVSFNLNPQSAKKKAGESFNADVHLLNSFEKDISSVDVIIQYDSSILGASFQPNGEIGYTTIINEVKDNAIHYVAVNSSRNPIIGTDLTLGTLTLTGKADGKGKVSLENIRVTASGNSSPLVIDTSSIGTTEREYTIGDIEPSSVIVSPSPAPSSAPTYTCALAGGQCTSVSTACSSLGSYVWGGYGSLYCPDSIPQCCLPVGAPAPDQSQIHNQCLKICEQGYLLAPGTFDESACIQECDSKYKRPESATVPIGNKPDLVITSMRFVIGNNAIYALVTIKNAGAADIKEDNANIKIGIESYESSIGSLKAGESVVTRIYLPADMKGKDVTVKVDTANIADESDETNNEFRATVIPHEFGVVSFDAPASVEVGALSKISMKFKGIDKLTSRLLIINPLGIENWLPDVQAKCSSDVCSIELPFKLIKEGENFIHVSSYAYGISLDYPVDIKGTAVKKGETDTEFARSIGKNEITYVDFSAPKLTIKADGKTEQLSLRDNLYSRYASYTKLDENNLLQYSFNTNDYSQLFIFKYPIVTVKATYTQQGTPDLTPVKAKCGAQCGVVKCEPYEACETIKEGSGTEKQSCLFDAECGTTCDDIVNEQPSLYKIKEKSCDNYRGCSEAKDQHGSSYICPDGNLCKGSCDVQLDKCQPPKVSCYPAGNGNNKQIFVKWTRDKEQNKYETQMCEKSKPFGDSSCESLKGIISDIWIFSKNIEEGKTYKVRARVSEGDGCFPSDWSEPAECSYIKPTVTLDVDSDAIFAGGTVKATVTAKDDYYGINYLGLDYGFDGITKDDQAIPNPQNYYSFKCDGQKLCAKTFLIDTKNYKDGKINLVAFAINDAPSSNLMSYAPAETYLMLKKDQPVRFDNKEITLLDASVDEKGSMKKVKIRIGETLREFDVQQLYQIKFIEGMSMRFYISSLNPLELGLVVSRTKTIDVLDLKSVVVPGKGSPGTMFKITADSKTSQRLSLSAKVQSSTHTSTIYLYDDGNHGDNKANDGFYANTITESEIGTYFVTIVGEDEKGRIEANNVASFTVSDLQSSCLPIIKNGDASNLIDVVFALNNYAKSDKSEVSKVISRHADFLFSKEPFKSNKDKFNLYYLGEYPEADCGFAVGDACISFFQKAVSSVCPFFDEIIVLDKNGLSSTVIVDGVQKAMSAGGYSRPRTAVVGTASSAGTEGVTVHEFGHSFGWLADEYPTIPSTSHTEAPNCDVFGCPKWCSGKTTVYSPKCYEITSEPDCKSTAYNYNAISYNCIWNNDAQKCDFPYHSDVNFGVDCKDDTACYYHCGGRAGYRSSKYSIMGDTNNGKVNDYNTISRLQIQKIIDNWGKGK